MVGEVVSLLYPLPETQRRIRAATTAAWDSVAQWRQQLGAGSACREVDFVVGIVLFEVDAVQFRHFQKSHEHRDHLCL